MADLPSILGGMAQGFLDFGKSAVDLFGTGGASIADLIESARTGKVTTKNSDDFRKWLYDTNDVKDAAAKGLGTALNGVQTVSDYIPGIGAVTRNPLFNAGQGALGGLADEFKMYGKDYDLGRAGQRAAVGAGGALASTGLADALKGSGNALLKSGTAQGLARGAVGGAIGAGGYTAIDGGSLGDVANSALQGAGMGAALGGTMGALQDFKPARTYDMALTDEEKAARIANAKNMLANEQDPERIAELNNQIKNLGGTLEGALAADDAAVNGVADTRSMLAKRLSGDALNDALDLADTLRGVGADIDDNGYVSLYHRTSPEAAKRIYDTGEMVTKEPGRGLYWSTNRGADSSQGYGDSVVTAKVPLEKLQLDDIFDNNADVVLSTDNKGSLDVSKYLVPDNAPKALENTLADADMAVNSPRYITDENGNPRTFYHGSPNANITEFDINQAGKNTMSGEHALFFTDDLGTADNFAHEQIPTESMFFVEKGKRGKVYPVNLEMNNPLDLDNLTDAQIEELWPYASYMGSWQGKDHFVKQLTDWRDKYHNAQQTKGYLDLDKLRDSQYDGIIARMYPNQDNQAREYAVFDNSKIKMLDDLQAVNDANIMASRMKPGEPNLARALSDQDLSVNNGISIYTDSMAPETRRALDIITQQDVPVENELYNRIDPETLPQGYEKLRNLVDSRTSIDEQVQKKLGKDPLKADVDELLDYLYPNEPLEKRVFHKSLNESIEKYKRDAAALGVDASKAAEDMARTKKLELIKKIYDDVKFDTIADIGKGIDVGDDLLYATQAYDRRGIRTGYPGALDTALSERLDIAPGNTIKIKDSQYDWIDDDFKRKNLGRYTRNAKDISVREGISGIEGDISTMAHERLHSFQNEARPENAGRYSKEVTDAYNELSKDLKPYIKDDDSIAKIYGASDTNYYASPIEQESRMLQTYLDNKGYTKDALYWRNKQNGGNPEWGNEINPAFDKFFDKLRDLSKRGVALPALTALFGGGALMANQQKDKEEVR